MAADEQASPEDTARQASELLDRRRVAQARALLRQSLAFHPDDAGLLLQAARADALDDDNASARSTLESILSRSPKHLQARYFLLGLLTEEGELAEAERLALDLIADFPQSADLFAAYARVMFRALRFPKARALAQEGLALDPDNDAVLRALALCDLVELPRGRHGAALGQLLAQHPEDRHTLALVLSALVQEGQNRAAWRIAKELLRAQPDDPHWLALVQSLALQNHWSMLPLWPLQRWGWTASFALWVGCVLALRASHQWAPALSPWLGGVFLSYMAYSWIWPPLLKRWLSR